MDKFFNNKGLGELLYRYRKAMGYEDIRELCRDVEQCTGVWLNPESMRNVEEGKSKISVEALMAFLPVLIGDDKETSLLNLVEMLSGLILWDVMPTLAPCPVCGSKMLLQKNEEGLWHLHCSNTECLIATGRTYRTKEEAVAAYDQPEPEDQAEEAETEIEEAVETYGLPKYLTVSEMSDFSRISNQTIYNHIKRGSIKAQKKGGKLKAQREDFLSFLKAEGRLAA